jgi:protein-S-isoprenylcysteine O-methyltransferase Ste14
MSIRRDFPDLPPVWAAGTFAAQLVLGRLAPVPLTGAWAQAAGWALVAAGTGLAAWAALWFRRKRTTIEPREEPRALIVEGPFRVNRNPIYTGMALVLAGTGLLAGALSAVLLAGAFVWVIDRRFVRGEEATLRDAFGVEADRYIAGTRRW